MQQPGSATQFEADEIALMDLFGGASSYDMGLQHGADASRASSPPDELYACRVCYKRWVLENDSADAASVSLQRELFVGRARRGRCEHADAPRPIDEAKRRLGFDAPRRHRVAALSAPCRGATAGCHMDIPKGPAARIREMPPRRPQPTPRVRP